MVLKIFVVMFLFFNWNVKSQICSEQKVFTRWVQEKYKYSYQETYMDKCFFGRRCKKTRVRYAENIRSVPKQVLESVQVCCSGYVEQDLYYSSGDIECLPICSPPCQNGNCISPGVCQCHSGFFPYPVNSHSCLPRCEDCFHGKCVAPNVCDCNFGYSLQNDTCQAICTEPCYNGTCIAPDTCECLSGYRKNPSNICTPYCSHGCWHGTCTAPETCDCDKGWHKAPSNECVPSCETECGNGTCTAPNICECEAGYEIDETKVPMCVPRCDVECGNGSCVAPNMCKCAAGYKIDGTSVPMCIPQCDIDCGNGTCKSPNICTCAAGYKIDVTSLPMCVPQCDIDCGNGTCKSPNVCECAAGYQINKSKVPMCEPQCGIACGNGTCIAPNVCECAVGYHINTKKEPMCVPGCEIECGNGTCNAPNICECPESYKADGTKVPVCVPDCALCDGICIAPGKCECEEPFKTKFVTADGQKCDNSTDKCTRTICTIESIETTVRTTEENISYGYDDFATNDTIKLINSIKSDLEEKLNTSEYYDYDSRQTYNISLNGTVDIDVIMKTESWTQSKWACAGISVVVIIIVIILGSLAIYWKSSRWCAESSYAINDKSKDDPNQELNKTMRLSALLKKGEAGPD